MLLNQIGPISISENIKEAKVETMLIKVNRESVRFRISITMVVWWCRLYIYDDACSLTLCLHICRRNI